MSCLSFKLPNKREVKVGENAADVFSKENFDVKPLFRGEDEDVAIMEQAARLIANARKMDSGRTASRCSTVISLNQSVKGDKGVLIFEHDPCRKQLQCDNQINSEHGVFPKERTGFNGAEQGDWREQEDP